MTEQNAKREWWQRRAEGVFRQALLDELYVLELFTTERRPSGGVYTFRRRENGSVVALRQRSRERQEYEAWRIEGGKGSPQDVALDSCRFWGDVYVDLVQMVADDYSVEDVEREVTDGARDLARRINKEFVGVLLASADRKVAAQDVTLGDTLAQVSDELSEAGFDANRLLFPKQSLHRLLRLGVMVGNHAVESDHYAGQTDTGLLAFWSSELPSETALVFDGGEAVAVIQGSIPQMRALSPSARPSVGMRGEADLLAVVRDIRSVTAISVKHGEVSSVGGIPVGEAAKLDEIGSCLEHLRFLKGTRSLLVRDFEEVAAAYRGGAYKACVVMCGALMEGLLLGNLERSKHVNRLQSARRLRGSASLRDARDQLRRLSLQNLIDYTQASGCVEGFTKEIATVVQRCRNSVHPGRVLRRDEVFDPFDRKVADLALDFLNLLSSLIAES